MENTTKLLLVLFVIFFNSSCEKSYTQIEVESLNKQGKFLASSNAQKQKELDKLNSEITKRNTELNAISKDSPKYVLKIKFSQSRFSLDITQHIKDSINSGEFEIPVDREFFNSVKIGDRLVDKFRAGSFILHGSFSSWNFLITDKRVE
jgi:hypothetical protein